MEIVRDESVRDCVRVCECVCGCVLYINVLNVRMPGVLFSVRVLHQNRKLEAMMNQPQTNKRREKG